MQEYKACLAHTDILKKYDFQVEKAFANIETAYKGSFKNGSGPKIAILAEYDALPVIGHGCGHNAYGVTSISTAIIHGIISKGGEAANIIPDLAVANFYVRAEELDYLKGLVERVKNVQKELL